MKCKYYEIKYKESTYKIFWLLALSDEFHRHHAAIELLDLKRRFFDNSISIKKIKEGLPVDFSSDPYRIPFISKRLGYLISQFAHEDVERIPILINDTDIPFGDYEILRVYREIDCIDKTKSDIWYFDKPEDINYGKPKFFAKIKLDYTKINDCHIFKMKDSDHHLFISEDLKKAIEEGNFTGTRFIRV